MAIGGAAAGVTADGTEPAAVENVAADAASGPPPAPDAEALGAAARR
jgi:hypothetical protein